MYATSADLLQRFGVDELAQVATPKAYPAVSNELMRATIDGADRSAYSADEIEAADAALTRIETALADATDDINMYLGARYSLPLDPTPQNLVRVAADIARYRLYEDHAPEEVRDRHKDALRLLEQIAQGKVPLGVSEPQASAGAPEISSPDRVFTRDTLEDF